MQSTIEKSQVKPDVAYKGWSILSVTQKIHGVTIAGQMKRKKKMVMIAS